MAVLVSLWKSHLLTSYCKKSIFRPLLTLWGGWSNDSFPADPPISMKLSIVSELYRPNMSVLVSLWKSLASETDWQETWLLSCSLVINARFSKYFVPNVSIKLRFRYFALHVLPFSTKKIFRIWSLGWWETARQKQPLIWVEYLLCNGMHVMQRNAFDPIRVPHWELVLGKDLTVWAEPGLFQ